MSTNPTAVNPRPLEAPMNMGGDSTVQRSASRRHSSDHAVGFSAFWPMLVFFVAWLAWAVFQGYQLTAEHENLVMLKNGQQTQVEQAQKVRQTLDTLGSETQRLADAGNANAKLVIDELRKRGVTVNRPAPGTANK